MAGYGGVSYELMIHIDRQNLFSDLMVYNGLVSVDFHVGRGITYQSIYVGNVTYVNEENGINRIKRTAPSLELPRCSRISEALAFAAL